MQLLDGVFSDSFFIQYQFSEFGQATERLQVVVCEVADRKSQFLQVSEAGQ